MVLMHRVGAEEAFKAPVQNVFGPRRVWTAWYEKEPSLPNSTAWESNANPVLKLQLERRNLHCGTDNSPGLSIP